MQIYHSVCFQTFSKLLRTLFKLWMTLLMKYPICSINFRVRKRKSTCDLHCSSLEASTVINNSLFWVLRMCAWFKWPHVRCHLCSWRSIRSKRWICSIFFRWGGYEINRLILKQNLFCILTYMWCNYSFHNLPPKHRKLLSQLCWPCGDW